MYGKLFRFAGQLTLLTENCCKSWQRMREQADLSLDGSVYSADLGAISRVSRIRTMIPAEKISI